MPGSLAIDRFQVVGLAPSDHPDPGRLKHAIGRIDRQRLVRSIGTALGNFGEDDQRVIVLRRLDIASFETMIGDADLLASQLAEGMRAAVARLSEMTAGESIVVFPTAVARIAAFVTAAACGEAWGKWWFSDLDHLKLLPVSSAIRVALNRDPATGLAALGALAETDRLSVLEALSTIDAGELLREFEAALAKDGPEEEWIEAVALPEPAPNWSVDKVVLHNLAVLANRIGTPSHIAARAIKVGAELRRNPDFRHSIAALRAGSAKAFASASPGLRPSTIATIATLRPAIRIRLAETIAESIREARSCSTYTPFGGVLLLWPHIPPFAHDRLPSAPGNRAGLLGLLAVAALFGAEKAAAALEAPILRRLLGVDPGSTLDQMAEWLEQVQPEMLPQPRRPLQGSRLPHLFSRCPRQNRRVREIGLAALDDFARRLPGLASASLPFLIRNVIGVGARVIIGDGVRAILDRPPLDVLLSISGLADRTVALPTGELLELGRCQ